MALLKLVDNVPNIDYHEYRDHEFYNKYKYRARFKFMGANFLYYAKTVEQWRTRIINKDNNWFAGRLTFKQKEDILSKQHVVKKFLEFKLDAKKNEVTIRIEGNAISFFSNNLDLLLSIKDWDPTLKVDITECKLGEYSGVKYFVRQPKNRYRVYLKSKRVTTDLIDQLKDMLEKHNSLKPSKGLEKWLKNIGRGTWRHRYCSSAYSIDYDDESMLSYLAICHGEILGKKYKLEKRETF